MASTPEQSCDMLSTIFTQVDRQFIFEMLKRNSYQVEATMDALFSLQEGTPHESHSLLIPETKQITKTTFSDTGKIDTEVQKAILYRGSKVHLPNSFLRIPGWEKRHKEAIQKKDFMTLFADPVFLREVEREFGADYEQVLRDHLRVIQQRIAEELDQQIQQSSRMAHSSPKPLPRPLQLPDVTGPVAVSRSAGPTDPTSEMSSTLSQVIDEGLSCMWTY